MPRCSALVRFAGALLMGYAAFFAGTSIVMSRAPDPLLERLPVGTVTQAIGFDQLPGWRDDDHEAALGVFRISCGKILDGSDPLRAGILPSAGLLRVCRLAIGSVDGGAARAFFETNFEPIIIRPEGGDGFLTAYFEPEIEASPTFSKDFPVPVLARPSDLVTLKDGEIHPGLDPALRAARQGASGYEPYPDRAAIWASASDGRFEAIAWLRDHAELFITQVQGSARLIMTDGRRTRLVYAGRNGHPYTSIGRLLVQRGKMSLEGMTLAKLMAWLRADPARGRALMEENRSYIFFMRDDGAPLDRGPIGGAGVPLTEHRSLAVDRAIWPYGLPVFINANPLVPAGGRELIRRLMIAQDTGSAIVGPARGDYFMGSGAAAGERAGLVRDPVRFVVLVPRAE
jgi:membrane-bound lytic murein transglycosylase A